jgi:putative endonuclease
MTEWKHPSQKPRYWFVYLVECADNSLYCGITTSLNRRVDQHNSGTASKYTRTRRPVTLVYFQRMRNKSFALKEEYRIKQLSKAEKLAMMAAAQEIDC